MSDSPARELACELIRLPSLTPEDAGCQALIESRLAPAGFRVETLAFGEVSNLWATHGSGAPLLAFAGHTDVVPAGPPGGWTSDPFEPRVRAGHLYGRGAADMKGSLAAMVVAAERFVAAHPDHAGTLAFLVTSDEEGPARDGTRRVMATLGERAARIDYCLVGEASSIAQAGDEIRIGRRGSLTARVSVHGTQGHVAYPGGADNAAHRLVAGLAELAGAAWPAGDPAFPPCSFQVSGLTAGAGADNIIPGEATALCNLRYPPPLEPEELQHLIAGVWQRHAPQHDLAWHDRGRPFLSAPGALRQAVIGAVESQTGIRPALSTGGGTSDGRFIAPAGAEVIELGAVRASIHKADEHVALADLETLVSLYGTVAETLLAAAGEN